MSKLVRKLADKRAHSAAVRAPAKEDLLRPEFRFKPAAQWLLLPDLAKQLSTNEEEREAVQALLDQGVTEARKLLAAEGAENDVAAATTLFLSQLWGVVRQQEVAEEAVDALHAQIVGVLAGPEMTKMSDSDKQRYWEFCIGFPVFVLGMREVATDPSAQSDLRKIAAAGFESVLGVNPELVDIGPKGMEVRAGLEAAADELTKEKEAAENPPAASSPASGDMLPSSGPAIPGITYQEPFGWERESKSGEIIFRATLGDVDDYGNLDRNNSASHQGTIAVLSVVSAVKGPAALFEEMWRHQFGSYVLGDTVVHYRGRMPGGLVVLYMGRFFARPNTPAQMGNPKTYGALWLVDLGGNRFQPIVALVEPRDPSVGMDSFKESRALQSLSFPLGRFLDSIKPARGAPPHPAGGFFRPSDLRGRWVESSSAYGGSYFNTVTGASAGVAVTASSGHFYLNEDGTYHYDFAYYARNPQFGNSSGATKHRGRYRLDGDVVLVEPEKPINYNFSCCAVGIGTRQTSNGVKRILVTVSANSDGQFLSAPLIPNWDGYRGVMNWYQEE